MTEPIVDELDDLKKCLNLKSDQYEVLSKDLELEKKRRDRDIAAYSEWKNKFYAVQEEKVNAVKGLDTINQLDQEKNRRMAREITELKEENKRQINIYRDLEREHKRLLNDDLAGQERHRKMAREMNKLKEDKIRLKNSFNDLEKEHKLLLNEALAKEREELNNLQDEKLNI